MQCTINELHKNLLEKVDAVYEVFRDFFGEEYVDIHKPTEGLFKQQIVNYLNTMGIRCDQYDDAVEISDDQVGVLKEYFANKRFYIFVWWPRVTVTNEFGRSVNIQDLYAKIQIQLDGRIPYECPGFLLNRATYTEEQFYSNYMHSHIQSIPKSNFIEFMSPCLGHGPINGTIGNLKTTNNEITWMLFCQELSMYVTVESVSGGPWKKMETIGFRKKASSYSGFRFGNDANPGAFEAIFSTETLRKFIKYYLQNGHLSINFKHGKYTCGMPYYEYILDISNSFIEYYNKNLKSTEYQKNRVNSMLLKEVLLIDGQFYIEASVRSRESLDNYQNKKVLTFKGKDILTHIIPHDESSKESFPANVLNNQVAMYILESILKIINFRYRNEYKYRLKGEITPSVSKRTIYL